MLLSRPLADFTFHSNYGEKAADPAIMDGEGKTQQRLCFPRLMTGAFGLPSYKA